MATLDEKMSDIADTLKHVEAAQDDLRSAESVEKEADFNASVDEAIASLTAALKELKALRKTPCTKEED